MFGINCWCRWPFLGFQSISLIFFGNSLNFVDLFWAFVKCLDSNQLITQAVSRKLESIQLMTQLAFQELTQNQLMAQLDSSGIDSDWLMTQRASPFFIQINSWLKQKAFDSKSTHDSILSHTHVCLHDIRNYAKTSRSNVSMHMLWRIQPGLGSNLKSIMKTVLSNQSIRFSC